MELSSDNWKQIYIPKEFGHAFLALVDDTRGVMRIDNYFQQEYRRGIDWNDPDINIPFSIDKPILAQYDIETPFLRDGDCNLKLQIC